MLQENNFKLSIIIPVFNEEQYLQRLFQDLIKYFDKSNTEILIIDDGSTDRSTEIIKNFKNEKKKFNFKYFRNDINSGKGFSILKGLKNCSGEYVLLQDADLELDLKDSYKMFQMIQNNNDIKCIFGSRYLSGKLKKNNYLFNNLIGKLNSLIFNIFFSQSLSDVHCGLKIIHRDVINKINLSLKDFGIEIDLASQIVKNNFFIYEYGVSYFFRTKSEGKKITWIDGVKSFYYLIKVRFFDNNLSTNLSLIYSSLYMLYFGWNVSGILSANILIVFFFLIGLIIGLKFKLLSSSIILFFNFLGYYFFTKKIIILFIFFIFGLFLATNLKKIFTKTKYNYLF